MYKSVQKMLDTVILCLYILVTLSTYLQEVLLIEVYFTVSHDASNICWVVISMYYNNLCNLDYGFGEGEKTIAPPSDVHHLSFPKVSLSKVE